MRKTGRRRFNGLGRQQSCLRKRSRRIGISPMLNLIQPTFVTHLPKELMPLAKLSPDDPPARTKPLRRGEGPTTVEVFECCINGQEIAPGYTEQNRPAFRLFPV